MFLFIFFISAFLVHAKGCKATGANTWGWSQTKGQRGRKGGGKDGGKGDRCAEMASPCRQARNPLIFFFFFLITQSSKSAVNQSLAKLAMQEC